MSVVITADNIRHFNQAWEMLRTLPSAKLNRITYAQAERTALAFAASERFRAGEGRKTASTPIISTKKETTPIKIVIVSDEILGKEEKVNRIGG